MITTRRIVVGLVSALTLFLGGLSSALAGFNQDSPEGPRRIFTQIAFAGGPLVTYHVFEPGPPPEVLAGQSFPIDGKLGAIVRFPRCPGLRPVMSNDAAPSSAGNIILEFPARAVFDSRYSNCGVQPTSTAQVSQSTREVFDEKARRAAVRFVNAHTVPAPLGTSVPLKQQQSADSLWGPVPNVASTLAAGDDPAEAFPQALQGTTVSGINIGTVAQPNVRRPRIKGYAAGQEVWFVTYETKGGLASTAIEAQWAGTRFPGQADLLFLAYGRAPLPAFVTNTQPNLATEPKPAVLNLIQGTPNSFDGTLSHNPRGYSPIWEMECFDGGFRPLIGPGNEAFPCGSTRFSQIGQPRSFAEVDAAVTAGLGQLILGVFEAIQCPILAVDFNDNGIFEPQETMVFANLDWDFDGIADGTLD